MAELARPGMDVAVLYARVMGRMLDLGSEYYPLALYFAPLGQEGERHTDPPIGQRLQAGDYITNETSPVWGGQVAQEDQPILLGPMPDAFKPLVDLQRQVWEAGLEMMKPGLTFGELLDFVAGFGRQHNVRASITMHGRGIGDDNGPLITPRAPGDAIRALARKPAAHHAERSPDQEGSSPRWVEKRGTVTNAETRAQSSQKSQA